MRCGYGCDPHNTVYFEGTQARIVRLVFFILMTVTCSAGQQDVKLFVVNRGKHRGRFPSPFNSETTCFFYEKCLFAFVKLIPLTLLEGRLIFFFSLFDII